MGCLNSEGQFQHWFANIHLSGPCNRQCYFCIGQHMMGLDTLNVLDKWPLEGIEEFLQNCAEKEVKAIYLTGTNTEPLLYRHIPELSELIRKRFPNVPWGVRSNGTLIERYPERWGFFDKASITMCSFKEEIYQKMMVGPMPNLMKVLPLIRERDIKLNVVLGPENTLNGDVFDTIGVARAFGIKRVNLREPYGQPHIGNPMENWFSKERQPDLLGMPFYILDGVSVLYWDVHYVEVESVNLYANGRISVNYPITKGYTPEGIVQSQNEFNTTGRLREQWLTHQ